MSFLNVVERHKAPFARGDAFVLATAKKDDDEA